MCATALAALTWLVESSSDPFGESSLLAVVTVPEGSSALTWWQAWSDATGTAPLLLVALMGGLGLWFSGMRASAAFVVLAVGLTALANPLVKVLVDRERPDVVPLAGDLSASYPSGHAATSAALALAAAVVGARLLHGRAATVLVFVGAGAFAGLVAVGQLLVGRHHPTDVVAGWLLAAAIVLGLSAARAWLAPRLEVLAAARG